MCTGVGRVIVISRAQIENLTTEYDGTFLFGQLIAKVSPVNLIQNLEHLRKPPLFVL